MIRPTTEELIDLIRRLRLEHDEVLSSGINRATVQKHSLNCRRCAAEREADRILGAR